MKTNDGFDTKKQHLPRHRDVLGDHLFQKVAEVFVNRQEVLVSKITGMLLERSKDEIRKMLQDEAILIDAVCQAWNTLYQKGFTQENEGLGYQTMYEDLGELLFSKVYRYEPLLAAHITGMFMEMDVHMLLNLISNESEKLQLAVDRAREALMNMESESTLSAPSFFSKTVSLFITPSQKKTVCENLNQGMENKLNHQVTVHSCTKEKDRSNRLSHTHLNWQCTENRNLNEEDGSDAHKASDFGEKIYQRAYELHADQAAKVTGMILELDHRTLTELVEKQDLLDHAIAKAFSVLLDKS